MEDLAQPELSDNLIEQFGRQILVPGIDEQGQLNLSKRKVCIIGLGALGTVASQYLVRSGIGEVHLIDPDQIEESTYIDKLIIRWKMWEHLKVKYPKISFKK